MRLTIKDLGRGFAQLVLAQAGQVLGSATMKWDEYRNATRSGFQAVQKCVEESIAKNLAEHLWRNAKATITDDEEAKRRLLEFGWSQEKIAEFAKILAQHVAQDLTHFLPEHR